MKPSKRKSIKNRKDKIVRRNGKVYVITKKKPKDKEDKED